MWCPRVDAGSVHCAVETSWVNGMQQGEGGGPKAPYTFYLIFIIIIFTSQVGGRVVCITIII